MDIEGGKGARKRGTKGGNYQVQKGVVEQEDSGQVKNLKRYRKRDA